MRKVEHLSDHEQWQHQASMFSVFHEPNAEAGCGLDTTVHAVLEPRGYVSLGECGTPTSTAAGPALHAGGETARGHTKAPPPTFAAIAQDAGQRH